MEIQYKIWFQEDGLIIFPSGLDAFFKQIEKGHSLYSAVHKMNTSYRFAWGKIKETEKRLGIRLMEINPENNTLQLTQNARASLKILKELEKDIIPILQKAEVKMAALKNSAQIRQDSKQNESKRRLAYTKCQA